MVGTNPQIADDILDFLSLEKARASADGVGDVGSQKGFFNGSALGICPHQYPKIIVASFFRHTDSLNGLCNKVCLCCLVFWQKDFDGAARTIPRPQCLVLAVGVVGDNAVGCCQNSFCGAVVLLQANFLYLRKVPFKHADILVVCSSPGINGLVVVSNHRHILIRQKMHHLVLLNGGVLEFVHHYVLVAASILLQHIWMLPKQADGKGNQVVKVHGIV